MVHLVEWAWAGHSQGLQQKVPHKHKWMIFALCLIHHPVGESFVLDRGRSLVSPLPWLLLSVLLWLLLTQIVCSKR